MLSQMHSEETCVLKINTGARMYLELLECLQCRKNFNGLNKSLVKHERPNKYITYFLVLKVRQKTLKLCNLADWNSSVSKFQKYTLN